MHTLVKSAHFSALPDPQNQLLAHDIYELSKNGDAVFWIVRLLGRPDNTRLRLAETIRDRLDRFRNTLGGDVNIPRRFEQLLQALNEDFSQIAREEKRIPLSDVQAVVGVLHGSQIFLSGIGTLSALFMHKSGKDRFVIYELDEQFTGGDQPSWEKPFLCVLDGELNTGDVFYIATRASAREITTAELQDILITLPPAGALKRISQHLSATTNYGALCFQVTEPIQVGHSKKINPLTSIRQLEETEEKTTMLLGTQKPHVAKWIAKITQPILYKLSSPGASGAKHIIRHIAKLIIKLLANILVILAVVLTKLYALLKYLLSQSPKAYKTMRSVGEKLPEIKKRFQKILVGIKGLSRKKRYAGIGILLFLLFLSGALTVSSVQRASKKDDLAFTALVESIVQKKEAAQASMIYNNTQQAQDLLSEATALLRTLPINKRAYETRALELQADLETLQRKIQGIEYVEINILGDLLNITDETCATATELQATIYCLSAAGSLYRLNELETTFSKVETTKGTVGEVKNVIARDNDLLFVDTEKNLGVVNLEQNTLAGIVSGTKGMSSIEDIVFYNDSVYALSAQDKQIIKMRAQGQGYEAGTSWIASALTDLSNARALAIDGNVAILLPNSIIIFASGAEQRVNFDSINPAMTDAVDIWTAPESDYFYVLDRSAGRVIVFKKTGTLVGQYMNDAFVAGIQLIVREDRNSILIATDSQVLSFSPTHLLE